MAISSDNDRLTIIISKKLKLQLKELADKENRSTSNYIVTILESYVQNLNNGLPRDLPRHASKELYDLIDKVDTDNK